MSIDFERTDWTPEEALRFYADQKNFDIVDGYARILDNGAIASNALKHHSLAHLEMKGDVELTELRAEVSRLTAELAEIKNSMAYRTSLIGRLEKELAELRAQEPVAYVVFDEDGPGFCAGWESACHEHINDAINEHDCVEAAKWKVVPVFARPVPAAQVVPEGWQLVPKEPTPEMLLAYTKCKTEAGEKWAIHQYKVMLAASPSLPSTKPGEPT